VEKGGLSFTIPAEKLEQMIDKYKPYVVQMLKNGLMQSGQSAGTTREAESPEVDLGASDSGLGEPAEIPESPDLGEPSSLPMKPEPSPEPEPETGE